MKRENIDIGEGRVGEEVMVFGSTHHNLPALPVDVDSHQHEGGGDQNGGDHGDCHTPIH